MVYLELKFNDDVTQIVVDQELVTIGRSKSCTYFIPDSNLSSKHCQLYIKDRFLFIEDLDSKNGILLNGIKITKEKVYLTDVLNIGATILSVDRFKLDPKSVELLTAPTSDDRKLDLELANSVTMKKLATNTKKKSAFHIKPKKINTTQLIKDKFITVFKFIIIITAFLVVYKLLR